ncbi:MAG: hypothetical protein QXF07_00960 [Candidatus Micrarchaeia archaeon]
MKFNFDNEKYNRQLDKNVFFKLSAKEKEIYLKLKKQVPVEEMILSIGDTFSKVNYKELEKEKLMEILSKAKSNSVIWERKMNAAEDILTAIRRSGSNPKMIFNLFFGKKNKKIEKPYWELTRTMYSIMGTKFLTITNEEIGWLNAIGLKNKYASEIEIIDPLFNILDTKEGHEFINHLYICKNTICTCIESRKLINELIEKTKEYKKEMQNEFIIFDILMKEEPNAVISFINKCMDLYWITHLFHVLKTGKERLINTKKIEMEKKKNKQNDNEFQGDESKKDEKTNEKDN